MAQTSSDTEVVVDLLVCAFDGEHGDEIPHHIRMTSKSVLNLYLHAQFSMILPYCENDSAKVCHGSGGIVLLRAE